MYRAKKGLLKLAFIVFLLVLSTSFLAHAQTATPTPSANKTEKVSELNKKIAELEAKISDLKSQENSLSSQIGVMDGQIRLTEARINVTKQQVTELEDDIGAATKKMSTLESSLTDVSKVLINRIVATYQVGGAESLHVLLSSGDVTDFFTRANYLRIVQAHDKKLMYNAQQARNDYANQKNIFEEKKTKIEALKTQLESYTAQLDKDKEDKERLLAQTKGSEATYQAILAEAKAEFLATQGIVSGQGIEGEVGPVNQGDGIATIILGASCNSSGPHLHFTVSRGGSTENPFSHLKSVDIQNNSGDPVNPSGSWEWPLNPRIVVNQGYGNTSFASSSPFYKFHNGIDITGSSSVVKAVKAGILYRGTIAGSGCRIKYTRVDHSDSDLDSIYLHVN